MSFRPWDTTNIKLCVWCVCVLCSAMQCLLLSHSPFLLILCVCVLPAQAVSLLFSFFSASVSLKIATKSITICSFIFVILWNCFGFFSLSITDSEWSRTNQQNIFTQFPFFFLVFFSHFCYCRSHFTDNKQRTNEMRQMKKISEIIYWLFVCFFHVWAH